MLGVSSSGSVSMVRSTGTGVGGLHCSSVLKISKLVVSRSSLSVGSATMLLLSWSSSEGDSLENLKRPFLLECVLSGFGLAL